MSRILTSALAAIFVVILTGLAGAAAADPTAASRSASPGTVLATIPVGPKPQDIVVSPDGRYAYLTTLDDGGLAKIDLETFAITRTVRAGVTAGAIVWGDDELIVADAASGALVFVDPKTLAISRTLAVGGDPIALSWSPIGRNGPVVVFSAFEAQSVGVVPLDIFESHAFGVGGKPWGVQLFDDGKSAIVADTTNGRVVVAGTALGSGGPYDEVVVGGRPSYIAVAPDESVAYVANAGSGSVDVIDLDSLTVAATYLVGGKPWGVAVSSDGDYLYVPDNSGGTVIAVDADSGEVLSVTPTGTNPDFAALSPDGTLVFVPNSGSNTLSVVQGYSVAPRETDPPAETAATEDDEEEEDGGGASSSSDSGVPNLWLIIGIAAGALVVLAGLAVGVISLLRHRSRAAEAPVVPPGIQLDPAATAEQLADYAQHPEYRVAVAAHPNAYPALLAWLGALGDPDVTNALRNRRP